MKKLIARQVKRLKNPLFLLLLVVAIGLGAYFLSGSEFIKGLLLSQQTTTQNAEMEKAEKSVSVKEGTIWPIKAKKETAFEVKDINPVTFTSEKDYGTWRWLHSDFDMGEVPNGGGLTYQLTDTSTALGTEITEVCIDFGDGEGDKCTLYEETNFVTHNYANANTYIVSVKVWDKKGRSDSSSQTIVVEEEARVNPGVEPGGGREPLPATAPPATVPPAQPATPAAMGEPPAPPDPEPSAAVPPAQPLIANFTISQTPIYNENGVTHNFYNKSNANPLTKATWNFGEGSPMTLEGSNLVDTNSDGTNGDTSHAYPFPEGNGGLYEATYLVSLTVEDDTNSAFAAKNLTVKKPVKADFTCKWNSIVNPVIGLTTTSSTPENGNIIIKVTDASGVEPESEITITNKNVLLAMGEAAPIINAHNNIYLLGQSKYVEYFVNTSIGNLHDTLIVEDVTNSSKCTKDDKLTIYQPQQLMLLNDVFKAQVRPVESAELPSKFKKTPLPANTVEEESKAAMSVMAPNFDFVIAPAGSTVYFEAKCLYGEKKVRIMPKSSLNGLEIISAKPLDYKKARVPVGEENLKGLSGLIDSKSAILDIFENEDACGESEPTPTPTTTPTPTPTPTTPTPTPTPTPTTPTPTPTPTPTTPTPTSTPTPTTTPTPTSTPTPTTTPTPTSTPTPTPEPITLGIPEITKPEKNEVFNNTPRTINIAWTEVKNAASYDLELGCEWCESNTDRWKNPGKFESSETAYTPTAPLPDDGEYRVRVRAKNSDLKGEWSNYTYFSFDTAPKYECNDGKDNDGDGYIDFGADAGCKTPEDPDEENPPARIVTACSDGKDNDADGYIDLVDIGCEDSNDVNEKNKTEPVATSVTFKQFCHDSVDPKDFADITEDDYEEIIIDIIKEEASIAYNDEPFEGEPIFIGYPKSGDTVFKPDQAIRRDEVIKIVELATCLPEHLKALDEYSLEESDFDDPEFDNPNYWGKDYMYLAKNADIIDKGDVAAKVSRAEFLKILLNIHAKVTGEDIESCKDKEIPFVDVKANSWYCPYAVKAYEIGIAEGLEDKYGNFRLSPNSILTRIDAAIWLRNYYVAITGSSFADTVGGGPTTIKPIEKISR